MNKSLRKVLFVFMVSSGTQIAVLFVKTPIFVSSHDKFLNVGLLLCQIPNQRNLYVSNSL